MDTPPLPGRRSAAVAPRLLAAAALVVAVALAVTVLFAVRAHAADERSALFQHKLADANTLVRQYAQAADDSGDAAMLTGAKDAVIRARLAAVAGGASSAPATRVTAGTHLAGVDVAPGVYESTASSGRCTYGWFVGAGYQDVTSQPGAGPSYVTLNEGDLFHSSGCGTWTVSGR